MPWRKKVDFEAFWDDWLLNIGALHILIREFLLTRRHWRRQKCIALVSCLVPA
jgi:hypothetical protein